jgi:hypothetical protein
MCTPSFCSLCKKIKKKSQRLTPIFVFLNTTKKKSDCPSLKRLLLEIMTPVAPAASAELAALIHELTGAAETLFVSPG